MENKKYGRLAIISETRDGRNFIYYLCKCDCGNEIIVYRSNLISGKTKSCGCYKKEVLKELYTKKNEFVIDEESQIVRGKTTNTNKEFIVDLKDYVRIKDISWYEASNGYIMHKDTNKKVIQLHRFITDCPEKMVVDHINHNIKDNRKSNLRICTQKENSNNRRNKPNCISIIKNNNNIYYVVQIKGSYCGCFKDYNKAIQKRNEMYLQKTGRNYL